MSIIEQTSIHDWNAPAYLLVEGWRHVAERFPHVADEALAIRNAILDSAADGTVDLNLPVRVTQTESGDIQVDNIE